VLRACGGSAPAMITTRKRPVASLYEEEKTRGISPNDDDYHSTSNEKLIYDSAKNPSSQVHALTPEVDARIRALRQARISTLVLMSLALEELGETDELDQYEVWARALMGENAEQAARVFDEAWARALMGENAEQFDEAYPLGLTKCMNDGCENERDENQQLCPDCNNGLIGLDMLRGLPSSVVGFTPPNSPGN
jgi:hypothetical protein